MDQPDVLYIMDLVNNHSELSKRVAALESKRRVGTATNNRSRKRRLPSACDSCRNECKKDDWVAGCLRYKAADASGVR